MSALTVSTGWLKVMGTFPIASHGCPAIEDGRDNLQGRWLRNGSHCSFSPMSRIPGSQHRVTDGGPTLRGDSWSEFRSRRDPQRPVRRGGIYLFAALPHLHNAVAVQV